MTQPLTEYEKKRIKAGLPLRRCPHCDAHLLWGMEPSGSGPLEIFRCPNGCAQNISMGIGLYLEPNVDRKCAIRDCPHEAIITLHGLDLCNTHREAVEDFDAKLRMKVEAITRPRPSESPRPPDKDAPPTNP